MNLFNLSLYKPTELEQWIDLTYQQHDIQYAADLDIDHIADVFNIEVRSYSGPSFAQWKDDEYSFMFLNGYLPLEKRREVFFHELCHPLRHAGLQDGKTMPRAFRELQEMQATHFQMYSAMPAYMLEEFEPIAHQSTFIRILAEAFLLPETFVERRIGQMMRRMHLEQEDRYLRDRFAFSLGTPAYKPSFISIPTEVVYLSSMPEGAAVADE